MSVLLPADHPAYFVGEVHWTLSEFRRRHYPRT